MISLPRKRPAKVSDRGATAGALLHGSGKNNKGLRLQVLQDQPRATEGAIQGRFLLLDAGDNRHTPALVPLLHRVTDAREVLDALRRGHPGCISVVNANILVVDADGD